MRPTAAALVFHDEVARRHVAFVAREKEQMLVVIPRSTKKP